MSQFISFQDLKSTYPSLSSLSVRVHGGLYGNDEPFAQTFTGDNESPERDFPISFSCTNPRIKNGCTGRFDVASSIHYALTNALENHKSAGTVCGVLAPGMTQNCPNFCNVEIQATY